MLVRVHYSLISVGTEIAPLRSMAAAAPDSTSIERGIEYASLAQHYLRASLRDPRKAIDRVAKIARRRMSAASTPAASAGVTPAVAVGGLSWTHGQPWRRCSRPTADAMTLVTDETPAGYQIMSQAIPVPPDHVPVVRVRAASTPARSPSAC